MSAASATMALESPAASTRADLDARRIERRCATRPRFLESWRKVITPEREPLADDFGREERARVGVWVAPTPSLVQAQSSLQILTDEDWRGLARLRTPAARDCALAARILLRLALSLSVERRIAPRDWTFERTALGKPRVTGMPLDINFSLSHTDAVTVVAVALKLNLGIDVEAADQDCAATVIAGFSHGNEHRTLAGLPPQQRAREFIRLWTHKEAYTKLLGCGHALEFSSIDCRPDTIHPARPSTPSTAVHFESFFVPVGHGLYHASLAVEKPTAGPVDVQLINVIGPGGLNGFSPVPVVN